jgi:hypothetical protein
MLRVEGAMDMGRLGTTICALILGTVAYCSAESQLDSIALTKQILSDYEAISTGPLHAEYVLAKDNFLSMREGRRIEVRIIDEPVSSLLQTMALSINWTTGMAYIDVNRKALTLYPKYKTVFFSMLTHELWHAYAYVQDPKGFKDFATDPFEKMMYQSDAYFVEGKFISEVLIPKGYKLTYFETYLSDCYKANSLSSFTSLYDSEDILVARELYKIREKKRAGGLDQSGLYKQCTLIGRNLLENLSNQTKDSKDFDVFCNWVSLFTFDNYAKTLVKQTETQRTNWDQIKTDFPDFYQVIMTIQERIKDRAEKLNVYRKQLIAALDIPLN